MTLRAEAAQLKTSRDKAQSLADMADSLLKTERAAQDKLAQQVRQLESENLALKADLGFFERLMPADGAGPLSIRSLQASVQAPGQLRYQLLVMQSGKSLAEFKGRYELTLGGTLDGKPWSFPTTPMGQPLVLARYARTEGLVEFPGAAVVKTVLVRVVDGGGAVRATHTIKL